MNNEKTAKVIDVIAVNKWDGPKGAIFFHKIALDNGDVGDIGKKANGAIKTGDSLNYTIEETQHGNRIKQVQQQNGFRGVPGGGGGGRGTTSSFALSYAKDICVANIAAAGKPIEMTAGLARRVTNVAEIFQNWLRTHE
jgi:hypothetical protein